MKNIVPLITLYVHRLGFGILKRRVWFVWYMTTSKQAVRKEMGYGW
jgi:hypothetical protein